MTPRIHLTPDEPDVEAALLAHLSAGSTVEIVCWVLSPDQDGQLWLTDPYGNDVMFLPLSSEGCKSALTWVTDDASD